MRQSHLKKPSSKNKGLLCACGSALAYLDCCGPYLKGQCYPQTAQALMCSRYVAYTRANMTYIQQTMIGPAAAHFDVKSARKQARLAQWLSLEIVSSQTQALSATVEFIARFLLHGKHRKLHEVSEFCYKDNRWFYYDGVPLPT